VISSRSAIALCFLGLLALVPTVIHSYAGLVITDGRRTSEVPTTLDGFTASQTKRPVDWGKRRFDSDDWFERDYSQGGENVVVTVVRSYDVKTLYHHPELAVAYKNGHTYQPVETMQLPGRQDIPVHVLRAIEPDPAVAMYALYYDDRFIADPIVFQLRTAAELVFTGRKPMTLFFVQSDGTSANGSLGNSAAARLLFASTDSFTKR
jgi:hypothetical protein